MDLKARTVSFNMTLELDANEVAMLAYLASLGGKAVKAFVGDKYTVEQWESLISDLRKNCEAMVDRMHNTKQVWTGEKAASKPAS